jgi:hypothetical protein
MLQAWKWLRVSRQVPCKVCHDTHWCVYTDNGMVAVCMRVESTRRARNGGWVHSLTDEPLDVCRPPLPRPCDRKLLNCGAYHAALRRKWDHWDVDGLSLELGVGMEALELLQPAFDPMNQAFAFPMRDGEGAVCGIRLRNFEGRKWAVRGSHEGLFYAPG